MTESENLYLFHNGRHSEAYNFFGCNKVGEDNYSFRVWAPHAKSVSVIGDFNGWDKYATAMRPLSDGESFEAYSPANEGDRYCFVITT